MVENSCHFEIITPRIYTQAIAVNYSRKTWRWGCGYHISNGSSWGEPVKTSVLWIQTRPSHTNCLSCQWWAAGTWKGTDTFCFSESNFDVRNRYLDAAGEKWAGEIKQKLLFQDVVLRSLWEQLEFNRESSRLSMVVNQYIYMTCPMEWPVV